jgi:DNA-binding response OmpR family regulator
MARYRAGCGRQPALYRGCLPRPSGPRPSGPRLRAEPATAGIPVAVLSAEAAPAVIRRMQSSGIVAYLTKPLDLAEFGRVISSFRAEEQSRTAAP